MADGEKPLRKISDAFKSLEAKVNSQPENVEIASFSHACSLVSPLFSCLGIAFKFAEMDYVAKVEDLREASKSIVTLNSMMELDIQQNSVRKAGSHTRNLLRVKRGLDMVKVLFEQIIAAEGNSLKGPASTAYAQVFAPHHGWAIRKAVAAGMYALPTKAQLLKKLNEDGGSFYIGRGTNTKAEFKALIFAILKCLELGFTDATFESDSRVVVFSVTGHYKAAWQFTSYVQEIRCLLNKGRFRLQHIFRQSNMVADQLAKEASVQKASTQWFLNQPPRFLHKWITADIRSAAYPRTVYTTVT